MPDQYIDAEKIKPEETPREAVETPKPELTPEAPEIKKEEPVLESAAPQPTPAPQPAPAPQLPPKEIEEEAKRLGCEEHHGQIQGLVDIAFQKGLDRAIEVAKKMNNPHLLDEFHDTLVDKLYNDLVQRGKLKNL